LPAARLFGRCNSLYPMDFASAPIQGAGADRSLPPIASPENQKLRGCACFPFNRTRASLVRTVSYDSVEHSNITSHARPKANMTSAQETAPQIRNWSKRTELRRSADYTDYADFVSVIGPSCDQTKRVCSKLLDPKLIKRPLSWLLALR
jgi:hypothetical protein